jgi:hypothetical protein
MMGAIPNAWSESVREFRSRGVAVPERAFGVKWFPERFFAHPYRRKPAAYFFALIVLRSMFQTSVMVRPRRRGLVFRVRSQTFF